MKNLKDSYEESVKAAESPDIHDKIKYPRYPRSTEARPLPDSVKLHLATQWRSLSSDETPLSEPVPILDRDGYATINDNSTYSEDYLRSLFPLPLFQLIIGQCRPIIRGYYLGAAWNNALKKLSEPSRASPAQEIPSPVRPILLTIEEAVILTKISRDTIERMIRNGDLRAANMAPDPSQGKACWRLRHTDIEDLIDRRLTARAGCMTAKKRPLP